MEPDRKDGSWLKTTQLTVFDFDLEFVEKFAHLLPGNGEFLGQATGGGAGNPAFRGRRPDFDFQFFYGHVPYSLGNQTINIVNQGAEIKAPGRSTLWV
jgi:hypothetical protein